MKKYKSGSFWTLISAFLMLPVIVCAQKYEFFEHYTTNNGLSSNNVMSLAQDKNGHIWIGTDLGLNRYDGSTFTRYNKSKYPTLYHEEILCMEPYADGGLMVGSYGGMVLRYDSKTDRLINVSPADYKTSYYKTSNGFSVDGKQTYLLTSNGVYQYDTKNDKFTNNNVFFKATSPAEAKSFYYDNNGRYLVYGGQKFILCNQKGQVVAVKSFEPDAAFSFAQQILPISDRRLMFAGLNGKLLFLTINDNGFSEFSSIQLPFHSIRKIVRTQDGAYWFATDGDGLWFSKGVPASSADFTRVMPYDTKVENFSKLYALVEDQNGNLWVGSQNSGLWFLRKKSSSEIVTSAQLGITGCVVSSFSKSPNGGVMVGSDGIGVYQCNTNPMTKKLYNQASGLTNCNVTSIFTDKSQNVWATTWGGGLYKMAAGSGSFSAVRMPGIPSAQSNLFWVTQLHNGDMVVCSGGDGLYIQHNGAWSKKELKHPKYGPDPDNWPYFIQECNNGIYWIFTSSTIWICNGDNVAPISVHYHGDSIQDEVAIHDACFVPGDGVYVATNQNVMRFTVDGKSFNALDYVPAGDYSSICIDKRGVLWTAGNRGIMSIDIKQKKCYDYPMDFSHRGQNHFQTHSKYIDENRIIFGEKDGFFAFKLNKLPDESGPKYMSFGDLYVSGQHIAPMSDILPKGRLENKGNLELKYNQTEIEITLDAVEFNEYKSKCAYKLEGLNDNWTEIGSERSIKFSYIPPGSYTLHVKFYMSSMNDDSPELLLHITVLPPWWQTWWFRLLIVLLIVAFVAYKVYGLRRDKIILQQKVDERTSELRDKNMVIEHRNVELNNALSNRDRLITVVAHDLKNPMFAIVGALEGLVNRHDKIDQSEQLNTLNNVLKSSRTLQDEMVKLLTWATSKQENIEYRPVNTHLQKIVEDDVALLKIEMDSKGVDLTSEFDIKNYAYIDGRMISTAVRNLLNNAIKFTPSGKSIHIKGWQEGDKIKLQVQDEGVGMSAEKVAELQNTERHISTDGTSGEKGTGLGTGIAREYVLQNNGLLDVSSELGVGTTFTLTLPTSQQTLPDEAEEASADLAKQVMQHPFEVNQELIEGNTILVVDDDPLIRENIKQMLESYVNVITAGNGIDALELVRTNVVDVILSDVEMPLMNGIELGRELAKNTDTNYIPIIFLSAKTTESDRLMGLLTGAIDYIPKPFSRNELLIKLTNLLTLRRKTQQRLLAAQMEKGINIVPSVNETTQSALSDASNVQPESADEQITAGTEITAESKQEVINPQLQQILEIIEKNYNDCEYTIEKLADDMCMTKITLYRRVKTLSGNTPIELLTEYRLNRAMKMLKETDKPISDVAYEVGFSDPAYFTRRFRSYFGYPPSNIREGK